MAIRRKIVRAGKVATTQEPAAPVAAPAPAAAPASVPTPVVSVTPAPVSTVVETGGKFRRLKDRGVRKVRRFERELTCADRDTIHRWWNVNQRLVPKEDPVCATIAADINSNTAGVSLSPMQVAGYFSYLCLLGRWTEVDRQLRLQRNYTRGAFSVVPVYSRPLLNAIVENWEKERQDEALRAQAHAQLRAARAAGQRLRIRSGEGVRAVIQVPQTSTPAMTPMEESFDVKWL